MRFFFALLCLVSAVSMVASPALAKKDKARRAEKKDKLVTGELALGLGIGVSTAGYTVSPNVFIDGGIALRLGPGSLTGGLRVGFQTYSTEIMGELPCPSAGPCVQADGGDYSWEMSEQVLSFGIPIGYRFLAPDKVVIPYVTVIPSLFLLRAESSAFDTEASQTDTQLGVQGVAGMLIPIGPGGMHFEAGYQYAPLAHTITGESSLSAVLFTGGYRFRF